MKFCISTMYVVLLEGPTSSTWEAVFMYYCTMLCLFVVLLVKKLWTDTYVRKKRCVGRQLFGKEVVRKCSQ
jgi:hypothetical protein